jgi:methionyl-tRNA synthetase
MSQPVLAAVAWPYANSEIHAGNLTSSHLPGDIIARYNRLRGRKVLMVSGSDSHGTPTTIRADAEKTTPLEVYQRFHATFLDLFLKLGITYDLFTSTHTENHFQVSQAMFKALNKNKFLYTDKQLQWFSPAQNRFLPDRYVEGTCYICGYTNARSDQCDNCGNLLDPTQLIDPRSRIDGSKPELRETEHYFLDLASLQGKIEEFLKSRESYWRPNVINQSLGQMAADKLHGRPITRDLDWGIPVPVEGWTGKCLYVWFEAVVGYLSATIEWSKLNGTPETWRDWWQDPDSHTLYFIGKDNIPFHAIIWPGELIGAGSEFDVQMGHVKKAPMVLPYNVPATEWLNLEKQKISGSRHWAVWGRDFLSRYDPDALRYYLTINMPETRDSDWDWNDFLHRNNDELVATWGNLANRVLAFTYKNWEGKIPEPGELTGLDRELLEKVDKAFDSISSEYEAIHLRSALTLTMTLAGDVNKYLDTTAPWLTIKTDKVAAGRACYVALRAIDSLKILFAPVLPFTSEKLNGFLGFDTPLFGTQYTESIQDTLAEHTVLRYDPSKATGKWEPSQLKAGTVLQQPSALFKKLDVTIVEEERSRLAID